MILLKTPLFLSPIKFIAIICTIQNNAKIVEKLSDNEYRGIFIFENLEKRFMLESNI